MSHDPKINELEHLAATDAGEAGYAAAAEQAAAILDGIAGTLRDPTQREPLGGTTLIESITRIISTNLKGAERSEACLGAVGQAARVAANLAADCDVNRTRLAEAGYVSAVIALLASRPVLPVAALRPVVASMLNLVVDRHGACLQAVSAADLRTIILLATEIYTPGSYTGESGIAGWLWTIADAIVPKAPTETLSLNDAQALLPPLSAFAQRSAPADAVEDGSTWVSADLLILAHATAILERFNAADKLDHAALLGDKPTMEKMLEFVENAVLPPWVEFDDDDDDDDEGGENEEAGKEQEKTLGMGKAAVARTIVSLLAEAQAPEWVWTRVSAWMGMEDRPDLVACALLSYGNKARSDSAATSLLPTVLSNLVPLMQPATPVLVQHALIGLLRNVSIPDANKAPLGDAGVIEKLLAMEPWADTRDVLGSIQGGAVGVVKNLVREPTNATRFLTSRTGVTALQALIKRTSDPAIAMEGCRVWVNAVRSLANKHDEASAATAWTILCTKAVIADLCGMISRGESYLVLVNEGVLALALLVAFGSRGEAVERALMVDPNAGHGASITDSDDAEGAAGNPPKQQARSPALVLAGILAPTPARPVGAEAQANALALVGILPLGQVRRVVRAEIAVAREEGRSVAAGVEVLDTPTDV